MDINSIVIDGAKSFFKLSFSGIKTLSKYEDNVRELREGLTNLRNKRMSIEEEVTLARLEGKTPKQEVNEWLMKVSKAEDVVRSLLEIHDVHVAGRGSKILNQCQQFWKVAQKLELVKKLINTHFETIASERPSPIKAVEEMVVPALMGQTATSNMKQLLEILNRNDIKSIAVWGMGGIGKTTVVKNLINELHFSSPNSFDVVIWVEVSRELDLGKIQSQIARRIHLKMETGDTIQSVANRILRRLKLRRNILLVLDNVWEKVDLDRIGIPSMDPCCKILLTTRSLDVCRDMAVDVRFQLDLMSEDDSWNLFVQSMGNVPSFEPLARKIVAGFQGLPLAIKTLGKSMRDKPQLEVWKNTYLMWQCSSPLFKNIEKEVFRPLEMSYKSLPSKTLQQCFLYCSLYPENFSINVRELIQYWLSDGLINENQSIEKAYNYGVSLVEHLKDSCLLDQGAAEGTVKMHDLFRVLAIKLSQNEELYGFHCHSGLLFNQMPKEFAKRVSFIGCKFDKLSDSLVYSQVTVLLLQEVPIKRISDNFFQNLKSLRVLNLSKTEITALPPSFLCLVELHSLFLSQCPLKKLPSLEAFCKLIVLDLSSTLIGELPKGLKSLGKLRELNLSHTNFLKKIVAGGISGLSSLETLDMSSSAYGWNMKVGVKATIVELLELGHLSVIQIRVESIECLAFTYSWLQKLRSFNIWVGPKSYDSNYHVVRRNEKRLVLRGIDLLQEDLHDLLQTTTSLDLLTCISIAQRHWLSLSSLISLTLSNCDDITCLISKETSPQQVMFPNLQHLVLDHLKNLVTIVEWILPRGTCLSSLKTIQVLDCPMLRATISYAMLRQVRSLEEITVRGCENMFSIIKSGGHKKSSLPALRVIKASNMVSLQSVCDSTSVCPVLQRIEVSGCFELKKLPLSMSDSSSLKEIIGDVKWWENLVWENHDEKKIFAQYFQAYPIEIENCSKRRKVQV